MKPRLLLLLVNLALLAAWLGHCQPAPLLARRELGTPRLHSGAYAPSCGTDRAVVPARRCRLRRVRWRSDRNLDGAWRGVDARAALARSRGRRRGHSRHGESTSPATSVSRSWWRTPRARRSRFRRPASGSRTRSTPVRSSKPPAKLERIGVPGGAEADATHIYVANVKLPHAGKYWLLAEPEGGKDKVQALGNVVVSKNDPPPDVGDPAPPSDTPTLASTGGDVAEADDADAAGRVAPAVLGRRLAEGEGAVRRDLRDAEVLRQQNLRSRRRRRGGSAAQAR